MAWPLIWGALCPSKSGLMNKHIVKHIVIMGIGRLVCRLIDRSSYAVGSTPFTQSGPFPLHNLLSSRARDQKIPTLLIEDRRTLKPL